MNTIFSNPTPDNRELLEGLRCWNKETLRYIYINYYPRIEEYVLKNKGITEDAKDLYHDTLLNLYDNLNKIQIELRNDFYYFFFVVCRRAWLNKLKEKSKEVFYDDVDFKQNNIVAEESDPCIYSTDYAEKKKLLRYHLNKLDLESQRIIDLRLANVPYKQIAEDMKLGSEQKARSRNHYCIQLLLGSIKRDRKYKELIEK
jgi:RNA polymerase sigma factor (sigma-70 family)